MAIFLKSFLGIHKSRYNVITSFIFLANSDLAKGQGKWKVFLYFGKKGLWPVMALWLLSDYANRAAGTALVMAIFYPRVP